MKNYTINDVKRFWCKVAIAQPAECWEWLAATAAGYGAFSFAGKPIKAHRFSWWIHYVYWPGTWFCRHKCDNRLCVNPEHLFLGTQKDNMCDANSKGRLTGGCNAKLSANAVREIRLKCTIIGITQQQLAVEFGIDQTTISRVIRRKAWKQI